MLDFSQPAKASTSGSAGQGSPLPWMPAHGGTPSSGDIVLATAMIMFAVALLVLDSRGARERLRRWSLVRHRFLRASFFEAF